VSRPVEDPALTIAWGTADQRGEIGAMTGAVAEWADDALAGGKPPKWIVQQMIAASRLIAAAARDEAVTL
jgi:hypothetical protein